MQADEEASGEWQNGALTEASAEVEDAAEDAAPAEGTSN